MRRARAFSHVDVTAIIVVLAIVVVLGLLIVEPFGHRNHRTTANRSRCAANLSGLYKAMYTYSVTEKDWFPVAGTADDTGAAIGFREGNRAVGSGAMLDNNVTASLWLMVRDGSCGTRQFVCRSSGRDGDPLTTTTAGSTAVMLDNTHDFLTPDNLSYSPINMHHVAARKRWNSAVPADYVLMADANDNDSTGKRHTLSKAASPSVADVRLYENSSHHPGGEGQNYLTGDGAVRWSDDPFVGRGDDNMYAMVLAGSNAPPQLGNSAGDAATDATIADADSALIPLTGNARASLAGTRPPKIDLDAESPAP